jgi:hypothetical protein
MKMIVLLLLSLAACAQFQYSANGTVKAIEYGKDGYTAYFRNSDSIMCIATISRIHLGESYKQAKPGDAIKVYGDTLKIYSKDTLSIRVKKIIVNQS